MKIYKMICLKTKEVYIGQTSKTLQERLNMHKWFSKQERAKKLKLYKAINEFGIENFSIELLEDVNVVNADQRELYWINFYNSVEKGLNTKGTAGKSGGDTLTNNPNIKDISKKLSDSKKSSKNPNSTKVRMIDLQTGEEKIFDAIVDYRDYLGLPKERHDIISKRCFGRIKSPYKGRYKFEYVTKDQTTIENIS